MHCFVNQHLCSGDSYTVFKLPNGKRCGILICYDNNLVENVRVTTLLGAEILLGAPSNRRLRFRKSVCDGKIDPGLWDNRVEAPGLIEAEFAGDKGRGWLMRWLPARAHDNGIFIVFSNGVGTDDDEVRTGTMILDPYGRVINETGVAADKLVIGVLDFPFAKKVLEHVGSGRVDRNCMGNLRGKGQTLNQPALYDLSTLINISLDPFRETQLGTAAAWITL